MKLLDLISNIPEKKQKYLKRILLWILIGLIGTLLISIFIVNFSRIAFRLFGQSINYHGEMVKVTLNFIGGIAVFWGVLISLKRANSFAKNVELQSDQIKLSRMAQTSEKFKNAIEHLSSDKNSTVLGGIHSLHRIALEDSSYTATVFGILCSYIIENTQIPDIILDKESKPIGFNEPKIVIQTIIDLLFKAKSLDEYLYNSLPSKFKGCHFEKYNFSSAFLMESVFENCFFNEADMTKSLIRNSMFNRSTFDLTILESCELETVTIVSSYFDTCRMRGIRFSQNCQIESSNFIHCNLFESKFENTKLNMCELEDLNLTYAVLFKTLFLDVKFSRTNFNRSDIEDCSFSQSEIVYSRFEHLKKLKHTAFSRITFNVTTFESTTIEDCSFSEVDFQNSRIIRVHAPSSSFIDIIIKDSQLLGTDFLDSSIEEMGIGNSKISEKIFNDQRIATKNCEIKEIKPEEDATTGSFLQVKKKNRFTTL